MKNKKLIESIIAKRELISYVSGQLDHFFPDKKIYSDDLELSIAEALDRTLFSVKHVKLSGYTAFTHLHSDIYAQFIYYLSNTVWIKTKNDDLATKLFYLNKSLHGLNCMYDTLLPDIFLLIHSVGTVLGKAKYADYFVACHNVTVGSDKGKFPRIQGPLYMGPGTSIIGDCEIGSFSHISIGCSVLNRNTPDNSVIVGETSSLVIKESKRNLIKDIYFNYSGN